MLARHKEDIETAEFNNFKTSLTNIIHRKVETFADLHAQIMEGITRDQDIDTIEIRPRSRINNMAELPELKHMICQIEALIQKAETLQDPTRQHEYTQKINKLISESKTNLLDFEARLGNNIETLELDVFWTSLVYATFYTNLIFMAPYKEKLYIYRYELPDLRSRIHNRIHITKQLLTDMNTSKKPNPGAYIRGIHQDDQRVDN